MKLEYSLAQRLLRLPHEKRIAVMKHLKEKSPQLHGFVLKTFQKIRESISPSKNK